MSGSCVSSISKLPSAAVSSDRADEADDEDDEGDVDEEVIELNEEADEAAESSWTTAAKEAAAVAISASLPLPPWFDLLNAAAATNARRRSSENTASDVCERARAQKSATSDKDDAGNGV